MIIGVAIRSDKIMVKLPRPNRHHHCFAYIKELGIHATKEGIGLKADDQGFYTHTGRYLNREQAYKYVKRVKQKHDPEARRYLFSEDIWQ